MPGILPQDNHGNVKMRLKREFREVQMWEPIQETQEAKPITPNTIYICRKGGFAKPQIVADNFPTTVATSPITHAFLEFAHLPSRGEVYAPSPWTRAGLCDHLTGKSMSEMTLWDRLLRLSCKGHTLCFALRMLTLRSQTPCSEGT